MGLWQNIKAEPVRWFSGAAGVVPVLTAGLVVFDIWNPTLDQLGYINGFVGAIATAIGITIVRNAVASKPNIEKMDARTPSNPINISDKLWPDG